MFVLGILAYPLSKLLDCLLGTHRITRYSNNDLKALIEMHTVRALEALEEVPSDDEELGLKEK